MVFESDVLVSFFALMTGLFFIPKLFQKIHIPAPITEFFLGVAVALWLPWLVAPDMVTVFATIGVITIFLFAGMELDLPFLRRNAQPILLSTISHLLLIGGLAALFYHFRVAIAPVLPGIDSLVGALLVALVLVTPSAGFIVSALHGTSVSNRHKSHYMAKAIAAEIVAILLLLILLQIGSPAHLAFVLVCVALIVLALPLVLEQVHTKLFGKLVNIEFPFFFVIALLSALATELLGLHYIIGAFIAGLVIHIFLKNLVEDKSLTGEQSDRLIHGMNFLATLFVPFYFFSVGLSFNVSAFEPRILAAAFVLFVVVSALRLLSTSGLLTTYTKSFFNEVRAASVLLPTLMIGFIVADLLHAEGIITDAAFAILIWYAILTSLTPIVWKRVLSKVVIPRSGKK